MPLLPVIICLAPLLPAAAAHHLKSAQASAPYPSRLHERDPALLYVFSFCFDSLPLVNNFYDNIRFRHRAQIRSHVVMKKVCDIGGDNR